MISATATHTGAYAAIVTGLLCLSGVTGGGIVTRLQTFISDPTRPQIATAVRLIYYPPQHAIEYHFFHTATATPTGLSHMIESAKLAVNDLFRVFDTANFVPELERQGMKDDIVGKINARVRDLTEAVKSGRPLQTVLHGAQVTPVAAFHAVPANVWAANGPLMQAVTAARVGYLAADPVDVDAVLAAVDPIRTVLDGFNLSVANYDILMDEAIQIMETPV